MADKERFDHLLLDIRELEKLIAGMRDAEMYPVSFFSQSFDLTHKILHELHTLEAMQIEFLRKQMEEHQAILNEIPRRTSIVAPVATTGIMAEKKPETEIPAPSPVVPAPEEPVKENQNQHTRVIEETIVEKVSGYTEDIETVILPEYTEEKPVIDRESAIPGHKVSDTSQTYTHPLTIIPEEKKPDTPPVATHKAAAETVVDKLSASNVSFNEILGKKILSDFRKAFSLNDRFYFRRELFAGDENRMNQVIADLNEIHSYEDSISYLDKELKWNIEDQAVSDFIKLIEKRFS